MKGGFYAGHSFEWMNKFLKAIERHHQRVCVAYAIACCIHHQFVYKRHDTFKLTHKALKAFGINRKCLKPYLSLFQQAGLIQYVIRKGRSPTIQLLTLPTNIYSINNYTKKQYTKTINKDIKTNHTGVRNGTGKVSQIGQVVISFLRVLD